MWEREMGGEARDKFVLGGLHMTDPANLITYMLKELTATETRGYISDEFLASIGNTLDLENLYTEQEIIYNLGMICDIIPTKNNNTVQFFYPFEIFLIFSFRVEG